LLQKLGVWLAFVCQRLQLSVTQRCITHLTVMQFTPFYQSEQNHVQNLLEGISQGSKLPFWVTPLFSAEGSDTEVSQSDTHWKF